MSGTILADSLTRIRNAQLARLRRVELMFSKSLESIISLLKEEGYIADYKVIELRPSVRRIKVSLKYYNSIPVINKIRLFSKPGKKMYCSVKKIPTFYCGLGLVVLSTSKGILSSSKAVELSCGGELLFGVY